MFVGRMIPNKKIEDVIRFFHAYNRWFNPRSRLLLVGAHSGFERYVAMLQNLIDRLGVPDVHFLGHVSNAELTAYYELADVFLCASEHEGFCVPLVESFHMGVPVLAYAATAIPATMDGAGILYHDKDPVRVAALIDQVVTNRHIAEGIVESQDAALDRLRRRTSPARCCASSSRRCSRRPGRIRRSPLISGIRCTSPSRSTSSGPFRPGAYQALPKEPSGASAAADAAASSKTGD